MMDVRISYNKNAGKLVNKNNVGTSKLLKLSSDSRLASQFVAEPFNYLIYSVYLSSYDTKNESEISIVKICLLTDYL